MFTVELYARIRRAVRRRGVLASIATRSLRCSSIRFRRAIGGVNVQCPRSWGLIWRGSTPFLKATARFTRSSGIRRRGFSSGCGMNKGLAAATRSRDYVAAARLRAREMFVPLSHRPGQAQADFGEADGYIGGKKVRFHYFCMDLPHSDGCFVKAYPGETASERAAILSLI